MEGCRAREGLWKGLPLRRARDCSVGGIGVVVMVGLDEGKGVGTRGARCSVG